MPKSPVQPPAPAAPADPLARAAWVKASAAAFGFELVGMARAVPSAHGDHVRAWIAAGRHGTMSFLERDLEQRLDVTRKLPWARSILCVGMAYYQPEPSPDETTPPAEPHGRIARYAWGRDYHRVLTRRLERLEKHLRAALDEPFHARAYVDTGPLLEREIAARAGLGWIGKHTLLIHPRHGSWFLLGELVLSLELTPDTPIADHCGTCTRCIDACPSAAITPYAVDAVRCLSYQTLENRWSVPVELHPPLRAAGYVAGCDICQEVCPHNHAPLPALEPDFALRAPAPAVSLRVIQEWTEHDWDRATRGRAHRRAKFFMWQRNARILAGDPPDPQSG